MSASVTAANLRSDGGLSAGRIDFYPSFCFHSEGFCCFPESGCSGNAYSFYNQDNTSDNSVLRTAFEYDIEGHTRLSKKYGSFVHVIEPSISYHYIASSESHLPVFDVTEIYKKTSLIDLSILNRIMTGGTEIATVRLTEGIDMYNGDSRFFRFNWKWQARDGCDKICCII